jgi:xanthine dehydrogenase small subunit
MFQLDGRHVVTVEGLGTPEELTPIQQAVVDCHASQCGFCTPGFVIALTGMMENANHPCEEDFRTGLTGNLCRCTGYISVFEAGQQLQGSACERLNERFPPGAMLSAFAATAHDQLEVEAVVYGQHGRLVSPTNLSDALEYLKWNPNAKIVAGATDIGVQINKGVVEPLNVLDLNRIDELRGASIERGPNGRTLIAGARADWSEIERLCRDAVPEFARISSIFGSPQIRHLGTLGGNIVNASPIADSLPFLMVMEAELELRSGSETRVVPITEFYRGYKQLDLRPGELLVRIVAPLPSQRQHLRLYKVSRRRDLDISTFAAAILMEFDGDIVADARIALGGVAPTVVRARKTESFLRGKDFDVDTMQSAGDIATSEIAPISDVRGAADYRFQLTRNVFLKYYHQLASKNVAPIHV